MKAAFMMMPVVAFLLSCVVGAAFAQEEKAAATLPEGPGLAAKYPGDVGIAEDAAVVFVEDFEEGTLEELFQHWNEVSNKDGQVVAFAQDVVPGSPGKQSLQMTATRGHDAGGHLYKVFQEGYDQLYARYYVRFPKDAGAMHHFVHLGGRHDRPPYPMGGAGSRPENDWSVGVEPVSSYTREYPWKDFGPMGIWQLYVYWPEMRSWQGPEGTSFYGNNLATTEPVTVPREKWICCELMVKMNSTAESHDGEMALWIDGKPIAHFAPGMPIGQWIKDTFYYSIPPKPEEKPFEGFRWRTGKTSNVNWLWLLYYVSAESFDGTEKYQKEHPELTINIQNPHVYFDHVVLAKEYIGPMNPAEK